MSCTLLQEFWCPSQLGKSSEHTMAKHMGSHRNARFPSQPPKQGIHICVGKCLASLCPMQFDEHMIGGDFCRMCSSDVSHNLINEIRRDIKSARSVDGLDLGPVFEDAAITDMETIFGDIDILEPKGECLPYPDCRLIEEPNEKSISLVATGLKQFLNLVFRDGRWTLTFLLLLSQDVFGDWRSLGDVMKKRFVPSGTSRQVGCGLVLHVARDSFHAPVIVIKAPNHRERVIDGAIRSDLFHWICREYLE